jgi:hypothetical protein
MKTFIDLEGASGRIYRFRLWPEGDPHQPIAGNYAYIREEAEGLQVVGIGATNDLGGARQPLERLKRLQGARVYTRLNVSRRAREAEHQDLLARYGPGFVGSDPA